MQASYRLRVEARLQSRSIGRLRSLTVPQDLKQPCSQKKTSQSRRIPSTILVQMTSDHQSRHPDVPKSGAHKRGKSFHKPGFVPERASDSKLLLLREHKAGLNFGD